MKGFFSRLFDASGTPDLGSALRPTPPAAGADRSDLNELIDVYRSQLTTSSPAKRRKQRAAIAAFADSLGGVNAQLASDDACTYFLQEVSQALFFCEQIDVHTYLTFRYPDNFRSWKLLGLASYWSAFRWHGLMYVDGAVDAFTRCLKCPPESDTALVRVNEWLLKAQMLGAWADDNMDLAAELNELIYKRTHGFYKSRGANITLPTLEQRFAAIADECQNDRGCDYTAFGAAVASGITRQLFNVDSNETVTLDGMFRGGLDAVAFAPENAWGRLCIANDKDLRVVDFEEVPEESGKLRLCS